MGACELCGKKTEQLIKVKIDSTTMNVCKECSKYGKKIETPKTNFFRGGFRNRNKNDKDATEEFVVKNYGTLIREARERQNLKPEDFAKKINEKESLLRKVESGNHKPSIPLARKIEKFFHIKLVDSRSVSKTHEEFEKVNGSGSGEEKGNSGLTFADILKNAMKKK